MKVISHKIFLKHDLEGHPETPERIRKALELFKFEKADDGEPYISKVHTQRYIDKVKAASEAALEGNRFLDSGETYVTKDTYQVACHAVGAAVNAADSAMKRSPALALVRPPGHHAHADWTNGFCIFNNMAIAAVHLAENNEKVLIVDIDMHRGDGTSEIVQNLNPDLGNRMFYFSINQQGVFPGMTIDEGNVKNFYLDAGTSENKYIDLLTKELPSIMRRFNPSVIAISAGFDSFATDNQSHSESIGCGLHLTKKTINELKKIVSGLPYFVVVEGGYNPDSIVEGVAAFLGQTVEYEREAAVEEEENKEAEIKLINRPLTEEELAEKEARKKARKKSAKKKTVKKKAVKKKVVKKTAAKKPAKKKKTVKKKAVKNKTAKKPAKKKKTVKQKTTKKKKPSKPKKKKVVKKKPVKKKTVKAKAKKK